MAKASNSPEPSVENPFGLQELNQKDSEEGHVTFTKGSKKMFFTKNVFKKNQQTVRKIYSTELRGGAFGEIFKEQIPFDSINGVSADACIHLPRCISYTEIGLSRGF